MKDAYICDAIRTPIGRYGGALKDVRADDLGAIPLRALMARNPDVDWYAGRRRDSTAAPTRPAKTTATWRAWPRCWPACRSRCSGDHRQPPVRLGLDAVGIAARAIKTGEAALMIAGGVESMTRAPFVMGKADSAFSRQAGLQDTTMGWRFINPALKAQYGVATMPETAENVARDFGISRADQDALCAGQPDQDRRRPRGRPVRR